VLEKFQIGEKDGGDCAVKKEASNVRGRKVQIKMVTNSTRQRQEFMHNAGHECRSETIEIR